MNPYGLAVRGEYDGTPGAGTSQPITLFDMDGNVRTIAANERLVVTDISYRCTAADNIRVFWDSFGDNSTGQLAAPTTAHTPAGTGIAAGTYTFAYTFFDPFTGAETPLSVTSAGVTVLAGDNITVTAPVAVPSWMKDRNGNQGFINVYRMDGGNVGLVGKSAAGANSVVLTSVAAGAQQPPVSGATGSGKVCGGALLGANGVWSDCFATGKYGPPGVGLKVNSSAATPIIIHVSGGIVQAQA